jgi:cytochrome c oxidase cbb3-type subunit 4
MTYQTVQSLAAMAGLFIFIALFVLVIVYVFWPSNKDRFERARHLPLERDEGEANRSEAHGR